METKIINCNDDNMLRTAADALKNGALVSIPTETVYGLGTNAFSENAVKKIFEVKGRPADNPLIVHIADIDDVSQIASDIPDAFYKIAEKLWPGPLSMIVKKSKNIPSIVSAGLDTVAIRMPDKECTRKLIRYAGCPIAAPSANISGTVSATSAQYVYDDFNGKIPYIIDGGNSDIGIESTVIDLTSTPPIILRPGGITDEDFLSIGIHAVYHPSILHPGNNVEHPASPGMKYKHYSPSCPVSLICSTPGLCQDYILRVIKDDECVFAFEEQKALLKLKNSVLLSPYSMPYKAASKIFSDFREADKAGVKRIFLSSLPEKGMGISYMNRVRKSAAGNIKEIKKIIFVCSGNTCRSPIAEYLMKEADKTLEICSRGLCAGAPAKMSYYSEALLEGCGIDTKDFMSTQLTMQDVREADVIYTMTAAHRDSILSAAPEAVGKVFTLKLSGDIADPFMGGEGVYHKVFNEILAEIARLTS